MKAWVIGLLVICAVVIAEPVESRNYIEYVIAEPVESRNYIEYGAINKCAGPNPPPGCNPPGAEQKNPNPVNEYSRGCSKIHRCRRD
nr:hypothetical protein [Arabidopsis thaliana]